MSTDVPLKVKGIAANVVYCLFRYQKCFQKSRHIQRYTLHVMVGTIHQLMNVLRIVRLYGLYCLSIVKKDKFKVVVLQA